jgi:hypothetical protein
MTIDHYFLCPIPEPQIHFPAHPIRWTNFLTCSSDTIKPTKELELITNPTEYQGSSRTDTQQQGENLKELTRILENVTINPNPSRTRMRVRLGEKINKRDENLEPAATPQHGSSLIF